jgi:hypothetical protein
MTLRLAIQREFLPAHLQNDSAAELTRSTSEQPLPDSHRITTYLASGHELFSAMGARRDALGGGEMIIGADSLRTDGVWLWREDLRYYFSRYHITLPADFLAFIREHDYSVPKISTEELSRLSVERRQIFTRPTSS